MRLSFLHVESIGGVFVIYSLNSSNLALDFKGYESISAQSKETVSTIYGCTRMEYKWRVDDSVTHCYVHKHKPYVYIRYVSVQCSNRLCRFMINVVRK